MYNTAKRGYNKYRDMYTIKSCGNAHSHCKVCRPDLVTATRSASLLPSALARSREAGKEAIREARREGKTIGRAPVYSGCFINNCEAEHYSRGWCNHHYQTWRRHGDALYKRPVRLCGVESCVKKHSGNGYCSMHLSRIKRCGSIELPTRVRRQCSLDGCTNKHQAKDFCRGCYNTFITSPQRRALKRGGKSTLKPKQWLAKVKEYDNHCAYCGMQDGKLTQDHIIPLSKGGHHTLANVVPACWPCNRLKGYTVNKYIPMRPDVIAACFSSCSLAVFRGIMIVEGINA